MQGRPGGRGARQDSRSPGRMTQAVYPGLPPITPLPPLPPLAGPLAHTFPPLMFSATRRASSSSASPSLDAVPGSRSPRTSSRPPFPPPTSPLPPIPTFSESAGPDSSRRRSSYSSTPNRQTRPRPQMLEEEEWRHPYAIAPPTGRTSNRSRRTSFDAPPADIFFDSTGGIGSLNPNRRHSSSSGGNSSSYMPPLDFPSPPETPTGFGRSLLSRRPSHDIPPHEFCAKCKYLKPMKELRAIVRNGALYCSSCRDAHNRATRATRASLSRSQGYSVDTSFGSSSFYQRDGADLDFFTTRRGSMQMSSTSSPRSSIFGFESSDILATPLPALPDMLSGSAPGNLYGTSGSFLDSLRRRRKDSFTRDDPDLTLPPSNDPWRPERRSSRPPSPSPTSGFFANLPPLPLLGKGKGKRTSMGGLEDLPSPDPFRPAGTAMPSRSSSWDATASRAPLSANDERRNSISSSSWADDEMAGGASGSVPKTRRKSFRRSFLDAFPTVPRRRDPRSDTPDDPFHFDRHQW